MENTVKRSIVFRVAISKAEQDEYRRIYAVREQLKKDEAELLKSVARHPDIRPAILLAGYDGKPTIEPSGESSWIVRFSVNEAVERPSPTATYTPYVAPFSMDPKTANLLLSGKILTDTEKRGLIERLAPGCLIENAEKAPLGDPS